MSAAALTGQARPGADEAVLAESLSCPDRFGELYSRYFAEIYRYLAGRLGPDAADDLAADTFLAAFGRRVTFDPARGTVRPWLYGIATKLVAGHRRAESRRYAALARLGADQAVPDEEERIAERVAAWQARRSLAGALARLADADRDVLLLVALAGLSYAETGRPSRSGWTPIPTCRSVRSRRWRTPPCPTARRPRGMSSTRRSSSCRPPPRTRPACASRCPPVTPGSPSRTPPAERVE